MRALAILVLVNKETVEIMGDTHVGGLRFADGGVLATELVVMAAGILPSAPSESVPHMLDGPRAPPL